MCWVHMGDYWKKYECILAFLAQSSCRPLVKTLNLEVWALPLIFLHDSTLFVIDMHQNRSLSTLLTPFDHFQKRVFGRLISWHLLRCCHKNIWAPISLGQEDPKSCHHIPKQWLAWPGTWSFQGTVESLTDTRRFKGLREKIHHLMALLSSVLGNFILFY